MKEGKDVERKMRGGERRRGEVTQEGRKAKVKCGEWRVSRASGDVCVSRSSAAVGDCG